MSDFLDLQAALLTYLRGAPSLQTWLGNPARVYDAVPQAAVYPYVGFGRVTASPAGGVGPSVTEQVVTLTCVSRFDGSEEAKAIAAELRLLLDDAELSLNSTQLLSLRVSFVDVFRASDLRTTYALVRVRAMTEPA